MFDIIGVSMQTAVFGKNIHYRTSGNGPVILFVHGWGGTIQSLTPLSLLFKNNQTITLDLPGFGKSDLPDTDWGIDEYAGLIAEFCKKLQLNDVVYFGHSFGGALGIYLASHQSTFIKKLVLCDASFKREGKTKKPCHLMKLLPAFLKRITYRILFPSSDSMKFPLIETNFRKIVKQDLTKNTFSIRVPTLILWGQDDKDTPVLWAHELHKNILHSKLIVFPHITHGLPLKYPELVYQEVSKFI